MTRMDNEKFKNGNYKIENRLKASDKRWEKMKGASAKKSLEKAKGETYSEKIGDKYRDAVKSRVERRTPRLKGGRG